MQTSGPEKAAPFSLRPPRDTDLPRLVALHRDASREVGKAPVTVEADFRSTWALPDFDRERDAVVVETEGGLAAWGELYRMGRFAVARGYVDPPARGRGMGRALVDWAVRMGRASVELEELYLVVEPRAGAHDLARSLDGFSYARTFYSMLNRAPGALPEPEWPAGIEIPELSGAELIQAVAEAHAGSFIDHWNYHPLKPETLEEWLRHPDEDPTLWRVAFQAGQVAGFVIAHVEKSPDAARGWIGELGTTRPFRGIGLGKALLRWACRDLAARGLDTVGLDVDGENPTGATRLYSRNGFEIVVKSDRYLLSLRTP